MVFIHPSGKVNASLDHLLSVFGLRAFANGVTILLSNLLLQRVFMVEANSLIEGHWLLVFFLQIIVHTSVLEPIITHLVPALVLLG